jgi:glyoxylase-like metal-dependent hydrolase (beta-lactamase superfamily II)
MRSMLNIRLREEETAIRQVERLGYSPADVRHILLTHLDFDHAGGLEDFPNATVHLMDAEFCAATGPRRGFVPRNRYRPRQFDEVREWRRYSGSGEPWFGFGTVRQLEGLPPEILLVPLPGHTWGHAGIAVDTGAGWMLHAGDAYFYRGEVRGAKRKCTPGLRAYQRLMETDRASRLANQERLRRLSLEQAGTVRIVCAHDAVELERCTAGAPL